VLSRAQAVRKDSIRRSTAGFRPRCCSIRDRGARRIYETAKLYVQGAGAVGELTDIISLLGVEETWAGVRPGLIVTAHGGIAAVPDPAFMVTEAFTGHSGASVGLADTLRRVPCHSGCEAERLV